MKTISVQAFSGIVEAILKDHENLAKVQGQKFNGVSSDRLINEIVKRVGGEWTLQKDAPFKFTPKDLNAVANSRFMRGTGTKLLMALAIVILGLAVLAQFHLLPALLYLALCGVSALVFFYHFAKKQKESRESFWKSVNGE